jgi:MFS family permease
LAAGHTGELVEARSQAEAALAGYAALRSDGGGCPDGEWALAGTFIAEIWPEDRRAKAGGYLQTGYYVGFFIASALNLTVGAVYGWRVLFLCGLAPVALALAVRLMIKEPARWEQKETEAKRGKPLREIFGSHFRQRTFVLTALLTCSIVGLWAGAVYAPAALTQLAAKAGYTGRDIPQLVSYSSMLFSFMTIFGCLALPYFAEKLGRRKTTGLYFLGIPMTRPTRPRPCRAIPLSRNAYDGRRRRDAGWRVM